MDTNFKAKDVRILRECLVGIMKKAPAQVQARIHSSLLNFAKSVSEYCQCEERVYIEHEQKHACLNCGKRHLRASEINLEIVP